MIQLRAPSAARAVPTTPAALHKLEQRLLRRVGRAIAEHDLIADGDHIMVCISGGKDSYALLHLLIALARRAPVSFDMTAVNIDQGWPGYRTDVIADHLAALGVRYEMVDENYAEIVESMLEPGQTPCSLCSRFRRGVLYKLAKRWGCSKIALGHHSDDLIETLVLNMFYSGRLAAMPARLTSDTGDNTVIRPLAYVAEADLAKYAEAKGFPIVSCGCPSCGLPAQRRQVVKRMLAQLEAAEPGIKSNMLAALGNVRPSHLLDPSLSRDREQ